MADFTRMELGSIRELVSGHITTAAKLKEYSAKCEDAEIKQMFTQSSKDAEQAAKNLIDML